MSDIWFTSDQHFGHKNIYKFETYLDWHNQDSAERVYVRPEFSEPSEGDKYMLDKLADCLKHGDTIYFGGDVAMNIKFLWDLKKLPGKKILILGNHDNYRMSDYRDTFKKVHAYRDISKLFPTGLGKQIITHCPTHMDSFYPHTSVTNIHGHIHEKVVRFQDGSIDPRYINISVELTRYTPLHIDDISALIANRASNYSKRFELGAIHSPAYFPKGSTKEMLEPPVFLDKE